MAEDHADVHDSGRMTLFDVIELGQNLPNIIKTTGNRVQDLGRCLSFISDEDLRAPFLEERDSAERTYETLRKRVEALTKALKEITVSVAGQTMPALRAFEFLLALGKQLEVLKGASKTCRPNDFNHEVLKTHANEIVRVVETAHKAYKEVFQGCVMALKATYVPREHERDLVFLYDSPMGEKYIQFLWNAEEECWCPPDEVAMSSDLEDFITDATALAREQGGWPHGTRATIRGVPNTSGGWHVTYTIEGT